MKEIKTGNFSEGPSIGLLDVGKSNGREIIRGFKAAGRCRSCYRDLPSVKQTIHYNPELEEGIPIKMCSYCNTLFSLFVNEDMNDEQVTKVLQIITSDLE